ncbi:thioredoxin [Geofilum sp. OHC36d9]|uniref:thioredoxin n=1 Tax=Geofilum sp. OHC36d9 TaxID=3458413 RepID=UPI00403434E1
MNFWYGLLAFVVILGGYIYLNYRRMKHFSTLPERDEIQHLNDKNFKTAISEGVVLVDFWASWCMPCKMMIPVLNDLSEMTQGKAVIAKLNVEEFQPLAMKFNIRSIPAMVLFKDGKEVDRFVGVKTKGFLLKQINEVL